MMLLRFLVTWLALLPLCRAIDSCRNPGDDSCGPVEPGLESVTMQNLMQHKAMRDLDLAALSETDILARNASGGHPRRYTDYDLELATKMLESPAGLLYFHSSKAVIKLCEYRAAMMTHVKNNGSGEVFVDDDINKIMANWCSEYTNMTGNPCDAHEPFNEVLTGTRCVLEAANKEYGYPTLQMFATSMELFDVAREDCMPDIIHNLKQEEGLADKCPGEWGKNPGAAEEAHVKEENQDHSLAEIDPMTSLTQSSSKVQAVVIATQEIWRVAEQIEDLADSLHGGSVEHFRMQQLSSLWKTPCATLGCDEGSWKDIEDVLYDHTAKLIELDVSSAVVHHLVEARGRVRRAHMKIMNSEPVLEALRANQHDSNNRSAATSDAIAFISSESARAGAGASHYDPVFRHGSRVLHAMETMIEIAGDLGVPLFTTSNALVESDSEEVAKEGTGLWRRRRRDRRRRRRRRRGGFWSAVGGAVKSVGNAVVSAAKTVVKVIVDTFKCMSVSVGKTVGFERQFSQSTALGVKVTLEDASNMADWVMGKGFSVCRTFKVHCTVTVAAGIKAMVGCSVGLSFSMQVAFDSCGSVQFDINVATGGGCSYPSTACPNIPAFKAAKIECKEEVGVGLTIMCAKFNLKTGKYEGGR
eukprot:TRINITY_DN3201_c0_g1_i5.p1 TRINITY_DN3201_c0_g1~~TRINITY_DN3201_c0_g1_i5.p1  ORF type:complete len:642 (+),score=93.06 TRINITY_DN3201_c0_g1_i5:80-2005(+)